MSIFGNSSQNINKKSSVMATKKILNTNNFSNQTNKEETKKSVRIKAKQLQTFRGRASIDFLTDQTDAVISRTDSMAVIDKSKSKLTLNYPNNK